MAYKCEILADSISEQGHRLTTFQLTYPRIVHAELMTHRVFSRNAASSRAVPIKKMIESVKNNMFTPLAIQKAHRGMQGVDYFEGLELEQAKQLWIESAELALQQAEKMEKFGITKQLINRILEPYQYYQVLVTATEYDNFFDLRCPKYHTPVSGDGFYFKSKKDCIANHSNPTNLKKLEDMSNIEWLQINFSQAEIHIQALAEAMWDAMNESTPKQLKSGAWHIPFGDKILDNNLEILLDDNDPFNDGITSKRDSLKVRISTARCARLSYMTFDGEIDYEKDLKLHDTLLESQHMSPFEHCAKAMSDEEYQNFRKGYTTSSFRGETRGWCNNYRGFINYRYILENQ